jgi:hypothetical protein
LTGAFGAFGDEGGGVAVLVVVAEASGLAVVALRSPAIPSSPPAVSSDPIHLPA